MKKFAKIFAGGFVATMMVVGMAASGNTASLQTQNVSALGNASSASVSGATTKIKAWCDNSNFSSCTISTPDGITAEGLGQPRAEY